MSGSVWEHFTKCPDDKEYATCNYCQANLNRKGGCTTAMWSHVKTQHKGINVTAGKDKRPSSPGHRSVQPNIKTSMASASQPKHKPMSKSRIEDLKRSAAWM